MTEPNIKPGRGGRREGAGRHTADGAKNLKNYQDIKDLAKYLWRYEE